MAEELGSSRPMESEVFSLDRDLLAQRSRPATLWDVVPPVPNLLAALVGLVGLMCGPWLCLQILTNIWQDAIGDDQLVSRFMYAEFEQVMVIALVGTPLFAVVIAILQAWQHHRPVPSTWPFFLAFPVAWALLVPECLYRGGSFVTGAVVASLIAFAFGLQWAALVYLREAMD
jgi:hypothetical protein